MVDVFPQIADDGVWMFVGVLVVTLFLFYVLFPTTRGFINKDIATLFGGSGSDSSQESLAMNVTQDRRENDISFENDAPPTEVVGAPATTELSYMTVCDFPNTPVAKFESAETPMVFMGSTCVSGYKNSQRKRIGDPTTCREGGKFVCSLTAHNVRQCFWQ